MNSFLNVFLDVYRHSMQRSSGTDFSWRWISWFLPIQFTLLFALSYSLEPIEDAHWLIPLPIDPVSLYPLLTYYGTVVLWLCLSLRSKLLQRGFTLGTVGVFAGMLFAYKDVSIGGWPVVGVIHLLYALVAVGVAQLRLGGSPFKKLFQLQVILSLVGVQPFLIFLTRLSAETMDTGIVRVAGWCVSAAPMVLSVSATLGALGIRGFVVGFLTYPFLAAFGFGMFQLAYATAIPLLYVGGAATSGLLLLLFIQLTTAPLHSPAAEP